MPLDPSILLGAKGIELPSPFDVAKQGLSLADLAAQNQMRQYALQTQADIPNAMQAIQGISDPEQAAQVLMRDHPRAAQTLVPMIRDLALKQAQTKEAQAKGTEAQANAFKNGIASAANIANGIVQSGQVDPMTAQQLLAQTVHAYKSGGIDTSGINFPSVMSSPDTLLGFAKAVQFAGTTPLDLAHMREVVEGNIPEKKALTAKAQEETRLAPILAGYKGTEAAAAATTAQTGRAKFLYGDVLPNALTGQPTQVAPQLVNGQWVARGAPVTTPTGESVQTQPTLGQQTAIKEQGPIYQQTAKEMAASQRGLQLVDQLMAVAGDPQALSGPLIATDRGRAILGTLSQLGLLTPEKQQLWANAKGSEVFSQELLGPLVQELGARGGLGLSKLVALGKPGLDIDPAARAQMANNVKQDFANQIALGQSKLEYMTKHAADDPLALKWKPPATVTAGATGKFSARTSSGTPVEFPDEASLRAFEFARQKAQPGAGP